MTDFCGYKKEVMPMKQSQREIVVAEFISVSVGDKTRPYQPRGFQRGKASSSLPKGAARYEAGFKCLNDKPENLKLKRSTSGEG